jgi:hypothetical protein
MQYINQWICVFAFPASAWLQNKRGLIAAMKIAIYFIAMACLMTTDKYKT